MKLSLHSLWYFSSDFDRCHWINGEIDSENSRKNLSNNWIDIGDFFLIFSYPLPLNKLNRWDIEHSQWLPRYLFLSFYSYSFASTNPSTVYVARCAVEFVVDRWLTDWDESISLWIFLDFSPFLSSNKKEFKFRKLILHHGKCICESFQKSLRQEGNAYSNGRSWRCRFVWQMTMPSIISWLTLSLS